MNFLTLQKGLNPVENCVKVLISSANFFAGRRLFLTDGTKSVIDKSEFS